jgi:hypothetical protein
LRLLIGPRRWRDTDARRARLAGGLALGVAVLGLVLPATVRGALPADVAVVAGKPITRQWFDHWMFVLARNASGPNAPAIVPTDPPRFNRCVARVRAVIPSLRQTPPGTLRSDCAVLFTNLSQPALDLLITADWQESQATTDGIVVTAAEVEHAYVVDRRRLYPSPGEFRRYLRRTGETVADVKFRVRQQVIREALLRTEHLSARALTPGCGEGSSHRRRARGST